MTQTSNTAARGREQPGPAGLGLEISTGPLPKLFLGQTERRTVSGEENFKGGPAPYFLLEGMSEHFGILFTFVTALIIL